MIEEKMKLATTILGGVSRAAKQIGVKPPTLVEWIRSNKPLPPKRCVQLEKATGGAVTRKDLRPNDWAEIWPELAEE